MRRMPMRRIVIVGATAGAVLLTGGVAFAFWSSSGTAVGAAVVAESVANLTVLPGASPSGLFPGGQAQDIPVTVNNTSAADILLADVTVTVTDVVEASGVTTACSPLDFAITDTSYAGEVIPAGDTTGVIVPAQIALTETGQDQNACKGASLVLAFVAN